jgi:hypothetical protein
MPPEPEPLNAIELALVRAVATAIVRALRAEARDLPERLPKDPDDAAA